MQATGDSRGPERVAANLRFNSDQCGASADACTTNTPRDPRLKMQ